MQGRDLTHLDLLFQNMNRAESFHFFDVFSRLYLIQNSKISFTERGINMLKAICKIPSFPHTHTISVEQFIFQTAVIIAEAKLEHLSDMCQSTGYIVYKYKEIFDNRNHFVDDTQNMEAIRDIIIRSLKLKIDQILHPNPAPPEGQPLFCIEFCNGIIAKIIKFCVPEVIVSFSEMLEPDINSKDLPFHHIVNCSIYGPVYSLNLRGVQNVYERLIVDLSKFLSDIENKIDESLRIITTSHSKDSYTVSSVMGGVGPQQTTQHQPQKNAISGVGAALSKTIGTEMDQIQKPQNTDGQATKQVKSLDTGSTGGTPLEQLKGNNTGDDPTEEEYQTTSDEELYGDWQGGGNYAAL